MSATPPKRRSTDLHGNLLRELKSVPARFLERLVERKFKEMAFPAGRALGGYAAPSLRLGLAVTIANAAGGYYP